MKDNFSQEFEEVVTQDPLLYGDFMTSDAGNYEEITDHTKVPLLYFEEITDRTKLLVL